MKFVASDMSFLTVNLSCESQDDSRHPAIPSHLCLLKIYQNIMERSYLHIKTAHFLGLSNALMRLRVGVPDLPGGRRRPQRA